MRARLLTDADSKYFNDFIAAQPSGSFLQSWQWGEWQKQLGHSVRRIMVDDAAGPIAAAQTVEVVLPVIKKLYVYLPYGPVVDQGQTPEAVQQAVAILFDEIKKQSRVAVFIRIEPKLSLPLQNFSGKPSVNVQPGRTLRIDVRQNIETLQAQMHPKTRYNIKVAQRHEVAIESELIPAPQHGLHLKEVADLLVETAGRQNFKSHSRVYYEKFIDFFAMQKPPRMLELTIYKALYQKQLLATGLMLDFADTRTYLFGGSSDEYKNVMAPHLMHWQAMQDAAHKGLRYYDFWGVETATGKSAGFVRFKQGFGGSELEYPGARDIVLKPLWYNLYGLLRTIRRTI